MGVGVFRLLVLRWGKLAVSLLFAVSLPCAVWLCLLVISGVWLRCIVPCDMMYDLLLLYYCTLRTREPIFSSTHASLAL